MQSDHIIHWFLNQGADLNRQSDLCDITPLSIAAQRAPFEIIKLLFQHGGSTTRGQLLNMASNRTDPDSVAILQFLFDHGDTNVNEIYQRIRPELGLNDWKNNGAPLHHAARVGNRDTVIWLLRHGANPSKRTVVTVGYGATPEDHAAYNNHSDIVDLLIQAVKDSTDPPGPIQVKPLTGVKTLDEINESSFRSVTQGRSKRICHGNGDPSKWKGNALMDYTFDLMIMEQTERLRSAQLVSREANEVIAMRLSRK